MFAYVHASFQIFMILIGVRSIGRKVVSSMSECKINFYSLIETKKAYHMCMIDLLG